jgi:hypothetical protein
MCHYFLLLYVSVFFHIFLFMYLSLSVYLCVHLRISLSLPYSLSLFLSSRKVFLFKVEPTKQTPATFISKRILFLGMVSRQILISSVSRILDIGVHCLLNYICLFVSMFCLKTWWYWQCAWKLLKFIWKTKRGLSFKMKSWLYLVLPFIFTVRLFYIFLTYCFINSRK